ncbi:MAG: response regulator [Mycobacteriaceae bacterium]
MVAALIAGLACVRAARRGGPAARGWTLLAAGMFVWAAAGALWAYYGVARAHVYPFPSVADVGFLGYAIPTAAGLLAFPRVRLLRVSKVRTVFDGLLIATGVLFVSGATVLGPVYSARGEPGLAKLVGIAYLVVDIAIASLVLILALRRPAGARLPWVFFGCGIVILTICDSSFVALPLAGGRIFGTIFQAGWVAAFLLIALATLVPAPRERVKLRRHFTVVQELLPYLPVLAAVIILAVFTPPIRLAANPFLTISGSLLLVVLIAQQVLVALEKVRLADDLESTVVLRTEQLRAADVRFRSLVQSSDDAIVGQTVEGLVTSWNPAAERLYGYGAEEIVGKSIGLIVPPDRRAKEAEILTAAAAGEHGKRYESVRLRKDGTTVPVALTVSPILDGNQVQGVSTIATDISERRRTEEALAYAREQALKGTLAKSEFLASMSHEIRTPMNGVIGLTGLLLDTALTDVQRRYATEVRGAGESLLAIIDSILDFSKLEAGKVELEQIDFAPRPLVEVVGLLLASTAADKGLEPVAYCEPEVPATLRGDPGRLRQVLLNLGSNAVKFTTHGEVVLSVGVATSGDAQAPVGEAAVRFAVTDTGLGIDLDTKTRLFQPFTQADASTTRRFGGTGLGLAICQRLVEAMGGQIDLNSVTGAGSTFSFVLTLPTGSTSSAPEEAVAHPLTGTRVLLVDDNATNRMVLSRQLTAWGLRPALAANAEKGLQLLRSAAGRGVPYTMAVIDQCMSDMDGLELAAAIAAHPSLAETRTLILASTGPMDHELATRPEVQQWIHKPVRCTELSDALMKLRAPCEQTVAPGETSRPRGVPPPEQPSAARGRVLVVEDNEVNQLVTEGVLHKLGFTVEIAADGRRALIALDAEEYDVVLMDCHMPEMDGFQATIELRRRESARGESGRGEHDCRRTPVIAMTAGVLQEDRARCLAAGMDDFVAKPVDIDLLECALDRQIGAWNPTGPSSR